MVCAMTITAALFHSCVFTLGKKGACGRRVQRTMEHVVAVEVGQGAGDLQRRRQDDVHVGLALKQGPLAAEGALVDGRLRSINKSKLSARASELSAHDTDTVLPHGQLQSSLSWPL